MYSSAYSSSLVVFGYIQIVLEAAGAGLCAFVFMVSDCTIAGGICEGVHVAYIATCALGIYFNYNHGSGSYYTEAMMDFIFSVMASGSICLSGFFYYYFHELSDPNVFNLLFKQYGTFVIIFMIYHIGTMISFLIYCFSVWTTLLWYTSNKQQTRYMLVPQQSAQKMVSLQQMPVDQPVVVPQEQPKEPQMVKVPIYFME